MADATTAAEHPPTTTAEPVEAPAEPTSDSAGSRVDAARFREVQPITASADVRAGTGPALPTSLDPTGDGDEGRVVARVHEDGTSEARGRTGRDVAPDELGPGHGRWKVPRVAVAAPASGEGKTTIAVGLMAALRDRGLDVAPFKTGPDYIDPGYHALATGHPGRNLDAHLTSPELLEPLLLHGFLHGGRRFDRLNDQGGTGLNDQGGTGLDDQRGTGPNGQDDAISDGRSSGLSKGHSGSTTPADIAVIEGAMGLFDGQIGVPSVGRSGFASCAHVVKATRTPLVVVLDASHSTRTLAAVAHGIATFDSEVPVDGVILNRIGSERAQREARLAMADAGLPVLGCIPRSKDLTTPSRHLGLVPAAERDEARAMVRAAADLVAQHVDLDAVLALAHAAAPLSGEPWDPSHLVTPVSGRPRIAVGAGRAFTFRYPETTELLSAAGCEVVEFDPMTDPTLPAGTAGLYLGGGFPEIYASELAGNASLRADIAQKVRDGLPTVAECAGLLYLCRSLDDQPMAGALDAVARMTPRLTLGYKAPVAAHDSLLFRAGEVVHSHEFHRTDVVLDASDPCEGEDSVPSTAHTAWTVGDRSEGLCTPTLHASYQHLHWAALPQAAQRFADAAAQYVPSTGSGTEERSPGTGMDGPGTGVDDSRIGLVAEPVEATLLEPAETTVVEPVQTTTDTRNVPSTSSGTGSAQPHVADEVAGSRVVAAQPTPAASNAGVGTGAAQAQPNQGGEPARSRVTAAQPTPAASGAGAGTGAARFREPRPHTTDEPAGSRVAAARFREDGTSEERGGTGRDVAPGELGPGGLDQYTLHHHGDQDLVPGLVDLAVNVRSTRPPAWLATTLARPERWAAYPDARPARRALATRHHVDEEMVLPTSGAAEAFTLVARAFHPSHAVVVHPQFTEPEQALRAAGIVPDRIILRQDDGFRLHDGDVPNDADLVVIGNPTNPTGVLHPAALLRRLARPGRVLLVDEAFMDAIPGEPESLVARDMTGILVTRSLTKTWSLAGIRAGCVVGDPALVAALERHQPQWSVSTPALDAMVACSTPGALAEATADARVVAAQREAFVAELTAAGFAPVAASNAPFVLIDTSPLGPNSAREPLQQLGFATRRGETFPGLGPTHLRLAVRDEATSRRFADALRTLSARTGRP